MLTVRSASPRAKVRDILIQLPDKRDENTDFGCYLQLTTTYLPGLAMIDYNCAYDSAFYQAEQRKLNTQILEACPGEVQRYINTPSAFLTPRDYFPNYDQLAEDLAGDLGGLLMQLVTILETFGARRSK